MSKALAERCRLHSASLLTTFCTRIIPVGTPAAENSAISTSGAGPLGNAVDRGGGAEWRDQAAIAAAAIPPLNTKARRVTFCRAPSSFRSESNIGSPSYWTQTTPRSYSRREKDANRQFLDAGRGFGGVVSRCHSGTRQSANRIPRPTETRPIVLSPVPTTNPGCPISRSFFARCGIPLRYPCDSSLDYEGLREPERSEMEGPAVSLPVLSNPHKAHAHIPGPENRSVSRLRRNQQAC